MTNPAFNLNEDGSAVDPAAFRAALKADSERAKKLQARGCGSTPSCPFPSRRYAPRLLRSCYRAAHGKNTVHLLATRARARRRCRGAAAVE
jgi:hypothetical protein